MAFRKDTYRTAPCASYCTYMHHTVRMGVSYFRYDRVLPHKCAYHPTVARVPTAAMRISYCAYVHHAAPVYVLLLRLNP